jgi:hypothetical protein
MPLLFAPILFLPLYMPMFKETNVIDRCVNSIFYKSLHTIDDWIILKTTLHLSKYFALSPFNYLIGKYVEYI